MPRKLIAPKLSAADGEKVVKAGRLIEQADALLAQIPVESWPLVKPQRGRLGFVLKNVGGFIEAERKRRLVQEAEH